MKNDSDLLSRLKKRDIEAFKAAVLAYAEEMTILAYLLLEDRNKAVIVVDDVLIKLLDPVYISGINLPIHKHLFGEIRRSCGY